ncbi:MAG TPA: DUF5060 domain-containing protein [Thermoanaerobaculia bacterium]|nr:DUF5060 domain-containing protein [Thermoanaerobaculia bacterium]
MKRPVLAVRLTVLLVLALLPLSMAHAVARFGTEEIILRADRTFNGQTGTPNPFTDVTLTAQVTSPSGKSFTVDGFFDGDGASGQSGNVFRIRIYADEPGTWLWRTTSNNLGLNGKTGTFSCTGTLAGVFGKGPVVENPANLRTFKYQYGEPVYLMGKFLDVAATAPLQYSHTLFSENLTDANRQALLDRHLGMKLNKMAVYLANRGDYGGSYPTTPWVGTASTNDKQRFNLTRWRMFERWVVKLRDAGMVAQLWFFADDSAFGDLPEADRKLLIRYAMARLSGYANTMFTMALEWQEGWTTTEMNTHAAYLHQYNPWGRMLSTLGTPGDFAFPTATWADYMQIQPGNGVGYAQVHTSALSNRAKANKPLMVEEYATGAESDGNRQKAWAAFMSAPAGSGTGAFLQHLSKFAALVDFEKMSPSDSLVRSGGAYGLAEANRAYVFYLFTGGAVTVDLSAATGTFIAEWYDPRTGAFRAAPATTGGGTRSFTAPASGDWVLYLHR